LLAKEAFCFCFYLCPSLPLLRRGGVAFLFFLPLVIFCFFTFARASQEARVKKQKITKRQLPLVLIFILSFPLLVAEQRQERIKIIIKTRVLPPLALRAKEAFFVFSPASCSYFYYYNKNNNKNEARAKEFKKTKMLPLQAKRKQGEQR
jgi:hypothetical protein